MQIGKYTTLRTAFIDGNLVALLMMDFPRPEHPQFYVTRISNAGVQEHWALDLQSDAIDKFQSVVIDTLEKLPDIAPVF